MRVFSTVLFMNGQPVGYDVLDKDGRKEFHPAASPDRRHTAPVLQARATDGGWLISGTDDAALLSEAAEELNRHSSLLSAHVTAAP